MMIVGTEEYLVSEHFVTAIMYGDVTGLEGDEEVLLDQWISSVMNNPQYTDCTSLVEVISGTSEFAKCSITGLMALCATLTVEFLKGDQ